MSNVDLVKEAHLSGRVLGEERGLDDNTRLHLGDRESGFVAALSFVPVADAADAALRAYHVVSCLEYALALADEEDKTLRLGWRLADALATYLETQAGVSFDRGRQTTAMEALLRRAG